MEGRTEEHPRAPGKTTIAPGVLVTIARLTSLSVEGVAGMAHTPPGVNRLFRKGFAEGIEVRVEEGSVEVDLHLILRCEHNVREVSKKVQREVGRAIEEMVGMEVKSINIHIHDIDYCKDPES